MSAQGSAQGRRHGDGQAPPLAEAPASWAEFVTATRDWAARLRRLSDLEAALASTAEFWRLVGASVQATVRLLDPSGERLLLGRRVGPAVIGPAPGGFHVREGFLGWVLEKGEVAFTNAPHADPRFQVREDQQWMPTAVIAAPLPGRDGPIGTLSAARDDGRPYDPTDAARLAVVAEVAGAHLEAGRQARLASTDALTLLPNRRHFAAAFPAAIEAARASGRPLSLVMLDLDHFSCVNNDFGHAAGDRVLCEVAERLRAACRETDVAIRWGGEEFAVLLPDAPTAAARAVAERIRRALADRPMDGLVPSLTLTGSLGVATLHEGEHEAGLLRRADQAVLEAKRRGRDLVVVWSADLSGRDGVKAQADRLPRAAPRRALAVFQQVVGARLQGRRQLGVLASGEPLWSRADDDHLVAHPGARRRLARVCRHLPAPRVVGKDLELLLDFGRPIGERTLVETGPGDDVVYARRLGRTRGCTRFVRGGEPSPCTTFRIVLRRTRTGVVEVRTAYVGLPTPPEPHSPTAAADPALLAASLTFWSTHALIWDGDVDPAFGVHRKPPAAWRR